MSGNQGEPSKRADLSSIIENLKNQKSQTVNVSVGPSCLNSSSDNDEEVAEFPNAILDPADGRIDVKSEYFEDISEELNSVNSTCETKNCDSEMSCREDSIDKKDNYLIEQNIPTFEDLLLKDKLSHVEPTRSKYGETTITTEALDITSQIQATIKSSRKRRMDRSITVNSTSNNDFSTNNNTINNNNNNNNVNNNVKNERLSPGTPDTSSRSRSVTPSSASHPGTPPSTNDTPLLPVGRNYSDFMRSLAAKYNNANPNDYFNAARNGFAPPLDARFKITPFTSPLPSNANSSPTNKETDLNNPRKPDISSIFNPFVVNAPLFPPLIDMSSTQTLLAMVRTAKEAELQGLLKNVKRPEPSSPLDLSSGAATPAKRTRKQPPSSSSPSGGMLLPKRAQSESPKLSDDVKNWTVDDVCNFVSGIDICAEYAQNFRDQRIDGSGLPLLTEEHLTSTINMKLGPALKLKAILAKKMGSCNICLHCTHCHNTTSPEPATTTGNTSDSSGTTS